jgi:hypothetical protein
MHAQAQPIPQSTAIPVVFTQSLVAGNAKPGDIVTAKLTQAVSLAGGKVIPVGTPVVGHVVGSSAFTFDPARYAVQKSSVLSVHFDKIVEGGSAVPVSLLLRAVAGPIQSHEAAIAHYRDESDSTGTRTLIGGSSFSPIETQVLSPNGDVVGYETKQGVVARLLLGDGVNENSTPQCEATDTEQAVGLFSPNACGVYGLNAVSMPINGSTNNGTFVLESQRQTVKVYAGSAALLQVLGSGL